MVCNDRGMRSPRTVWTGVAGAVILVAGYAVASTQGAGGSGALDQLLDDRLVSGTGVYTIDIPAGMTVASGDDVPASLEHDDVLLVSRDRLPDGTPRVSAVLAVLEDPAESFPADFDRASLAERFPVVSATELLSPPVTVDLDGDDAVSYDVLDTRGPPVVRRTTVTLRGGRLVTIAVAQLGTEPDDELVAVSDQLIDGLQWSQ